MKFEIGRKELTTWYKNDLTTKSVLIIVQPFLIFGAI